MSSKVFRFSELDQADLVIDAVYEGGPADTSEMTLLANS